MLWWEVLWCEGMVYGAGSVSPHTEQIVDDAAAAEPVGPPAATASH